MVTFWAGLALAKILGFTWCSFSSCFPRFSVNPSFYPCPCVGPLLTPTLNSGWPGAVAGSITSRNNIAGLVFKRTGNFYLLLGTLTSGSLELVFEKLAALLKRTRGGAMWRGEVLWPHGKVNLWMIDSSLTYHLTVAQAKPREELPSWGQLTYRIMKVKCFLL